MSSNTVQFVPISPQDEYLHPVVPDAHHTALETSFFGFNVPEAGIDGQYYVWFHPALKIMTVMIYVYRGIKSRQLSANYFNEHVYLPIVDRIDDYSVDLGGCRVRVKVRKPLEEIELQIDDPGRGFHVDLVTRAVFAPVGRPGGGHFTQVMENSGSIVLDGERHAISGYFVRDRSWGYCRGEEPQVGPPYNWMTGVFGRDLAFHVAVLDTTVFEAPQFGPDWDRGIDLGAAVKTMRWDSVSQAYSKNLRGGYWFVDSPAPRKLTGIEHRTHLGRDRYTPVAADLVLHDETGERHELSGRTLSFMPKMYGQNCVSNNAFMEWRYRDRIGYGELMLVYDNNHLRTLDAETGYAQTVLGERSA